jgi:hypothetical protein
MHLLQLLIAAQLADQLVERHVGGEELGDPVLPGEVGHAVDELVQPRQVGFRDPRHCEAHGQYFQRFPDLVGIDELPWRERPDLSTPARPDGDESLSCQPAHGLAYWSSADSQLA